MNVFEMVNPTPVEDEPVYGYLIEDQYQECFPIQSDGYVLPTAAVSCVPADYDELDSFPVAYDSDEFLEGMMEILAESDHEKKNLAYAESFPIIQGQATPNLVYPAFPCYAVPEATRIEDKDGKLDEFDFPLECVAAFESMDMSDNLFAIDQGKANNNELFCVGTIDIDYLKSLNDAEEKREKRKDAINRWKLKKLKRKSVIKAVKQSVSTFQEGAAVACNTLLNARQKATAKRERENGKFKKTQVKWVSVTDLFNSTFEDFK